MLFYAWGKMSTGGIEDMCAENSMKGEIDRFSCVPPGNLSTTNIASFSYLQSAE